MLRPVSIFVFLAFTASSAWSQLPGAIKPKIQRWTLVDGKLIDAAVLSADEEKVEMLVRTTAPVSVFDERSKTRIEMLSQLPPEELVTHQQTPEPWASSSGKVVSAIFESAQGSNVTFLVSKELSRQSLNESSQSQLQEWIDVGKVPEMDLGEYEVPSFELSTDQAASMDLTAKPDIELDLTKKAPTNIKLDRYKFDEKLGDDKGKSPLKTPEVIKPVLANQSSSNQQDEKTKMLARQKKRAAANDRIAYFMKEFGTLFSQRGDSAQPDDAWRAKYNDFITRLDQSRKLDGQDIIAYSSIAIAAAAAERGDKGAVVKNLLMLSEYLLRR